MVMKADLVFLERSTPLIFAPLHAGLQRYFFTVCAKILADIAGVFSNVEKNQLILQLPLFYHELLMCFKI